jgi:hypothetical protein
MKALETKLHHLGLGIPSILLPSAGTDLTKWAVVACDQYTSQPEYWKKVEETVGSAPSTLRIIFPEVYLEAEGKAERIEKITRTMRQYLDEGVLVLERPGFILVDRQTAHTPSRKGLIVALDLECYDYNPGAQTLIRATEGTVLDRLPPRIRIRENALLELPHIMVLIDDPDRTVIEPIAAKAEESKKIYDCDLMMNGMHLQGYKVDEVGEIERALNALAALAEPKLFQEKYGVSGDEGVLLYAVGDGNHSLATAKACWEQLKVKLTPEEQSGHPARYALVELVNVHDAGLQFEPIHRVLFGVEPDNFFSFLNRFDVTAGLGLALQKFESYEALRAAMTDKGEAGQCIPYVTDDQFGILSIRNPQSNLAVGTLQSLLDAYIKQDAKAKIDYIHGDEVVKSLGLQPGNIGFCLPPMDKNDLFKTVIVDGVLPRKTFSMGEAEEKRFYMECRKIVKD